MFTFQKIGDGDLQKLEGMSENERMDELMENLHFETSKDAAIVSDHSAYSTPLLLPLSL